MSRAESAYREQKDYLSHYSHKSAVERREAPERLQREFKPETLRALHKELPKIIPFLEKKCGVEFRGRILEIGAGSAWLSAELSKLPRVVEVFTTDFSPRLLKEHAPKTFRLLKADTAKITRMPADFHQLPFPAGHFDFVVVSGALHEASNIVQVLREAKRVLKSGGKLVSIREPVWPLVKLKSRRKMVERLVRTGVSERYYTLSDYKEFFKQAALPMESVRVSTATGFKYLLEVMVNGLTHARYAFIGTKRNPPDLRRSRQADKNR